MSSPRERVGKYDLSGLSKLWDDTPEIRDAVRDNKNLLQQWDAMQKIETNGDVDKTIENCKLNAKVLIPVLGLMRQNSLMLPALDRLIQAIDWFYSTSKKVRSLEHCYKQAWAIRDLISVIKGFTYRENPPTETCLNKNGHFFPNDKYSDPSSV